MEVSGTNVNFGEYFSIIFRLLGTDAQKCYQGPNYYQ